MHVFSGVFGLGVCSKFGKSVLLSRKGLRPSLLRRVVAISSISIIANASCSIAGRLSARAEITWLIATFIKRAIDVPDSKSTSEYSILHRLRGRSYKPAANRLA